MEHYGLLGDGSAYTASLPESALRLLNKREKASLDIQFAYLKVAWRFETFSLS